MPVSIVIYYTCKKEYSIINKYRVYLTHCRRSLYTMIKRTKQFKPITAPAYVELSDKDIKYAKDTYQITYPRMAYEAIIRCGAKKRDLGQIFGVDYHIVLAWERMYPEFRDMIREGRYFHVNKKIERSLSDLATGYEYYETKVEDIEIKQGRGKQAYYVPAQKKTVTKHHHPANVVAIMFWLANRDPERWKNIQRQIIESNGKLQVDVNEELDLSKLGRKDLEELRELVGKAKADEDAKRGTGRDGSRLPVLGTLHSPAMAFSRN